MPLTFDIQPFYGGVSSTQKATWDKNLFATATYLYQLCGKYSGVAKGIAAQNSGQVTYNTNTGQILNGWQLEIKMNN